VAGAVVRARGRGDADESESYEKTERHREAFRANGTAKKEWKWFSTDSDRIRGDRRFTPQDLVTSGITVQITVQARAQAQALASLPMEELKTVLRRMLDMNSDIRSSAEAAYGTATS
jgi:hypothetical protein